MILQLCVGLALLNIASALDNGLALTPPMGWLSWLTFGCNVDCVNDPDNCISENLFKAMADYMVSEGYADVGYEYVIIDDCWLANERDGEGKLQPDPDRFPSGIKALADYVHSKGLKFGIYEDIGTHTCGGYPGILDHFEVDAQTFADWEVDYVKLDGCYFDSLTGYDEAYPEFGGYLNKTGRPMVYSCSWPAYQEINGIDSNYALIAEYCNLWRNYYDIGNSWGSVQGIANWFAENQDRLIPYAGPGHWNDPDMLIIGNTGLNEDGSKAQMAIWAILASPLLLSLDLRSGQPEFKAVLQNTEVIAVNQDPLGIQGRRVSQENGIEIWTRPITPVQGEDYSYAVAVINLNTGNEPSDISFVLRDIGLTHDAGYVLEELYGEWSIETPVTPDEEIPSFSVNPGGAALIRASAV